MSRFQEETVDNLTPTSNDGAKKFKFEANFKYRVGFPHLKKQGDAEKVSIIKVGFFPFNEELKFSCLVTDDEDLNKQIQAILGNPRYRYATPIVVYKTDKDGKPVSPPSYDVVPFVFSDDPLKQLQDINAEWDLSQVDVFIRIKENSDVKMQNLTITPTKEALWRKGEKSRADIQAKATEIAKIQHTAVASDYSEDYIRTKLGLGGGNAPAEEASESWSEASAGADGQETLGEGGDLDGWV